MKELLVKHIAELIEGQVSYFNGWAVSDETMERDCRDAAEDILAYLKRKKLLKKIV